MSISPQEFSENFDADLEDINRLRAEREHREGEQNRANLHNAIREIVLDEGSKAFDKRRHVHRLIREALFERGYLCRTEDDRSFYFSKSDRRLYDLEQMAFSHLLTETSGLSPTEVEFRFLRSMLQAEAARTSAVKVHTLSYFDSASGLLAISDGGPGVWMREGGGTWKFSYNGEAGLLFFTEPGADPWTPDFKAPPTALDWFLAQIPFARHGNLSIEDQRVAYLICLMQLFFPPLRRTCIIPAFLGPQGSGKSTAERLTGRFLVGSAFDVMGLRADKEDSFVAAVTNRLVCGLDNADSRVKWLEDALATYATRQRYQLRKLYTTNEVVSYLPRAFLMLSSRDPQFRRPDVAERLLPFHFEKLAEYRDEDSIFSALEQRRPEIWGALLNRLGVIADALQEIKAPTMKFRMVDYAAFGWRVSKAKGKETEWIALLKRLEAVQAEFAGTDDGLIEVLRLLLEQDRAIGPIPVGDLFEKCRKLAADRSLPLPRTAQGFGQKLTGMRQIIELELNATFAEDREHQSKRFVTIAQRGSTDEQPT